MCEAVAKITDKFSFAYIQEAFVAALLAVARKKAERASGRRVSEELTEELNDGWVGIRGRGESGGLEGNVLWEEIQKQVKILRENMDEQTIASPDKVEESEWTDI